MRDALHAEDAQMQLKGGQAYKSAVKVIADRMPPFAAAPVEGQAGCQSVHALQIRAHKIGLQMQEGSELCN